ncbi:MAG: hypothetical protein AAGI71_05160 [Bacteroidota bacterium]
MNLARALAITGLSLCSVWMSYAQDPARPGFTVRSAQTVVHVQAPAPSEALGYLERTLADMAFFRANGYQVSLPDHPLFDGSEMATADADERRLRFIEDVYAAADFEAALAALQGQHDHLRTAMERLASWGVHDGLQAWDSVTVTLTLYGPGGSFDPDAGHITLWTDTQGQFKGGGGLHTIIHEMIHLAVEHGIAQPLHLQHWERERLVDLLAQREFTDLLPDYRLQGGPEAPMDRFVADAELAVLKEAVADYVRNGRPEEP